MNKPRAGFTIVELVIVIVVIGILAAITTVAYNGITERARSVQFLAAFDAYDKALRSYYTFNSSFPMSDNPVVDGNIRSTEACIGSGYVKTADFDENVCSKLVEDGVTEIGGTTDPAVDAAFATIMSPMSAVSESTTITLPFGQADDGLYGRGLMYKAFDANGVWTASLYYYTPGDQACGRGEKFVYPPGTLHPNKPVTLCQEIYYGRNL